MTIRKTITRPANVTAYSAGDVINDNGSTTPIQMDFTDAIKNPFVLLNQLISSNELGAPLIDAYFYSSSFTIAADNLPFDPADSDAQNYFLGVISHTTWRALVSNKSSEAKPSAPFELTTGAALTGKVHVVLVAANGYTPISKEAITILTSMSL